MEIETEGKTIEDAINKGLLQLNAKRENVEIKILNDGMPGLFGLGGPKPARVKLTINDEAQKTDAAIDYALAQIDLKQHLEKLIKLMNADCEAVNTAIMNGRLWANITSIQDSALLIGKNGQTLDAIEHIANLMLRREPLTRVKVSIDIENYRQKQNEHLAILARKTAAQVKQTGKLIRMEPMNSKQRFVVHLTLKNDPDVETYSEDEGRFRKVVVKLTHS